MFDAKGGQGSGNFGHSGRPGQIGGSGEGGGKEPREFNGTTEEYENILNKEFKDFNESVTEQEKNAIDYYTSSDFEALAQQMRYGGEDRDIEAKINNIDSAFEKIDPLKRDVILYRGVTKDMEINEDDLLEEKCYCSLTTDKEIAKEFAGNGGTVLKIKILKGNKIIPGEKDQKEFILNKNTSIRFKSFEYIESEDYSLQEAVI